MVYTVYIHELAGVHKLAHLWNWMKLYHQFPFTTLNGIFQNLSKFTNSMLKKSFSCKAESRKDIQTGKCVELGMEFVWNCVDFWTEFRNKLDYLPESV